MGDELGREFDVVVVGTGLPESILAAAATRADLSVLHLDRFPPSASIRQKSTFRWCRNNFYGGAWASFNLQGLSDWAEKQGKGSDPVLDSIQGETFSFARLN